MGSIGPASFDGMGARIYGEANQCVRLHKVFWPFCGLGAAARQSLHSLIKAARLAMSCPGILAVVGSLTCNLSQLSKNSGGWVWDETQCAVDIEGWFSVRFIPVNNQ